MNGRVPRCCRGLSTRVRIGDDDPPSLESTVPPTLADPDSARYVSGVGIQDYTGVDPDAVKAFHSRCPGLPVHITERSLSEVNGGHTTLGGGRRHRAPPLRRLAVLALH